MNWMRRNSQIADNAYKKSEGRLNTAGSMQSELSTVSYYSGVGTYSINASVKNNNKNQIKKGRFDSYGI